MFAAMGCKLCCIKFPCAGECRRWQCWLRLFVLLFYGLLIALLPFLIKKAINDGYRKSFYSIPIIGGVFVMMTLPMSFYLITQHMRYYSKPKLQKHIIRILWMVPIYSLNAWFSLLYTNNVVYLNSFRECYEAFVIYSFMKFLFNYLHENHDDLEFTLRRKPQVNHIFPMDKVLMPWKIGRELIHKCRHGILQYTVMRPLMTIVTLLCYWNGDSTIQLLGYIMAMIVNNFSQCAAMYCLALFYWATREELAPMKPFGKFLCIKAVIFFSFFQSVIITLVVWGGLLDPVLSYFKGDNGGGDMAEFLQNFLLCFEMFLAAIGHHYSYPVDPYAEALCSKGTWKEALYALWDFSDVGADMLDHLGLVGTSITRRITTNTTNKANIGVNYAETDRKGEASPLLVESYKHVDDVYVTHREVPNVVNGTKGSSVSNDC